MSDTVNETRPTPAVELVAERITSSWAGVRRRVEEFRAWRKDLTDELIELPVSLRRIRHGAENFELVGERLATSSESLEEVTRLYNVTLSETTRRSAEAADAIRSQMELLVGQSPDRVMATLADLQRTFETMSQLNPLWPRRGRPTTDDPSRME